MKSELTKMPNIVARLTLLTEEKETEEKAEDCHHAGRLELE
jgi:hypothetical protein